MDNLPAASIHPSGVVMVVGGWSWSAEEVEEERRRLVPLLRGLVGVARVDLVLDVSVREK